MPGGYVELSVEIELSWGYHDLDRDSKRLSSDRSPETQALECLLEYCDQLSIPITFDIVGHLLLDSCSGTHDIPYPERWLSADPGTDAEHAPMYYAPDLVERIRSAETNHEICTHTFTHIICNQMQKSVVEADLCQVQRVHEDILGDSTQSLVPPRNSPVPSDILLRNGIKVVRQVKGEIPSNRSKRFWWYLNRTHPVVDPSQVDGLTVTFTSPVQSLTSPCLPVGQERAHPTFRAIPLSLRNRIHLSYIRDAIERAIEQRSHAHLWTHLHDMANEHQLNIINRTMREISSRVDTGTLQVKRMCDLTD